MENAFNLRNEPISQRAYLDIKKTLAEGVQLEAQLWLPKDRAKLRGLSTENLFA